MTHKQKIFAAEYVRLGNATEAAKLAGYSPKTAYSIGQENLNKPEISKLIARYQAEAAQEAKVDLIWWLKRLKQMADFDPRKFFDEGGNLLPVKDLPEDCAKALTGMELLEVSTGTGENKIPATLKKIKFTNRIDALNMIAKQMGIYTNELAVISKLSDEDLDRIIERWEFKNKIP